jgi:hypothetical protein
MAHGGHGGNEKPGQVIQVGHGGHGGGGKKKSEDSMPYVIGSSVSGILEVIIFHPIDTIAKRLMSNTTAVFQTGAAKGENWGFHLF